MGTRLDVSNHQLTLGTLLVTFTLSVNAGQHKNLHELRGRVVSECRIEHPLGPVNTGIPSPTCLARLRRNDRTVTTLGGIRGFHMSYRSHMSI